MREIDIVFGNPNLKPPRLGVKPKKKVLTIAELTSLLLTGRKAVTRYKPAWKIG
jgi:hypothetical protein